MNRRVATQRAVAGGASLRSPSDAPPAPRSWRGVIYGEAASKANSRVMVPRRSKAGHAFMAPIKSEKAQQYVEDVARQIVLVFPLLVGRLRFTATLYYATERPDLDESALLDALQGRVYANDRQVRERHIFHAIDRANPRAEVLIEEIAA